MLSALTSGTMALMVWYRYEDLNCTSPVPDPNIHRTYPLSARICKIATLLQPKDTKDISECLEIWEQSGR